MTYSMTKAIWWANQPRNGGAGKDLNGLNTGSMKTRYARYATGSKAKVAMKLRSKRGRLSILNASSEWGKLMRRSLREEVVFVQISGRHEPVVSDPFVWCEDNSAGIICLGLMLARLYSSNALDSSSLQRHKKTICIHITYTHLALMRFEEVRLSGCA